MGIAEDVKLTGLDKPPSERGEKAERMNLAQSKDVYVHAAVIILAWIVKEKELMLVDDIISCLTLFFYCRVANTAAILLGLPGIAKMLTYLTGMYYIFPLVKVWNISLQEKQLTDILNHPHAMIAILMCKNLFIGILEQVYNILKGQFDISEDQVVNP